VKDPQAPVAASNTRASATSPPRHPSLPDGPRMLPRQDILQHSGRARDGPSDARETPVSSGSRPRADASRLRFFRRSLAGEPARLLPATSPSSLEWAPRTTRTFGSGRGGARSRTAVRRTRKTPSPAERTSEAHQRKWSLAKHQACVATPSGRTRTRCTRRRSASTISKVHFPARSSAPGSGILPASSRQSPAMVDQASLSGSSR
jgi:hypothetical protein